MKLMKLFAILALVGMSNAAFGYGFRFSNKTDQQVNVTMKLRSVGSEPHVADIWPGQMHSFLFTGAECLESVLVNGQSVDIGNAASTCKDVTFDITSALGTQGVNFKLSPAK